jgi:drug/metabolite transporter (DMT)-like permease
MGMVALVSASMCWASGSLFTKYSAKTESPAMNITMQMLCGGASLIVVALVNGEFAEIKFNEFSGRSLAAFFYLVVFGSWVGFGAYVWLLRVSTPSRVSTYAYVNPVIAVFLGWAILGEVLTDRMLWAALVILLGVIIITLPASATKHLTFGALTNRALKVIGLSRPQ